MLNFRNWAACHLPLRFAQWVGAKRRGVGGTPCWALPVEQVRCLPTFTQIYKTSAGAASVYPVSIH